jgi:hypothetical protein
MQAEIWELGVGSSEVSWEFSIALTRLRRAAFRGTISRNELAHRGSHRMAKQAVARTVDLEPIDRLEEKIKLLVSVVAQLRAEQAKSPGRERPPDSGTRLAARAARRRRARLDASSARCATKRELIRTRVAEMLEQLETI